MTLLMEYEHNCLILIKMLIIRNYSCRNKAICVFLNSKHINGSPDGKTQLLPMGTLEIINVPQVCISNTSCMSFLILSAKPDIAVTSHMKTDLVDGYHLVCMSKINKIINKK